MKKAIALPENSSAIVRHHGPVFFQGGFGKFGILRTIVDSSHGIFGLSGLKTLLIRSVLDQCLSAKVNQWITSHEAD